MDDKNWETEGDFVKVGDIGVDAGLVWIGDPCYIQDDSPHNPLRDWGKFCKWLEEDNPLHVKAHGMLGVAASTGYGDGMYPVYARLLEDEWGHKRVAELRVVFVSENENEVPSWDRG